MTFIIGLIIGIFIGVMIISLCRCMTNTSRREEKINEERAFKESI
jgi:uncharacterized membrane-anchored protein YhcB (DUF1043 family)